MGGAFSCIDDQVPPLQRLQYDMSTIKAKSLPIIWLVGPPGSGRNTQAKLIAENLDFSQIKIAELLRDEATKDHDRGKIVYEALSRRNRKVPDSIVIDLIKEDMLRKAGNAKGYVVNNFPKNSKQANLFVKEIDDVDAIIYLICDLPVMIHRKQKKIGDEERLDEEGLKKAIVSYQKDVKEGILKFSNKMEKIQANDPAIEVYNKIEAAVTVRINARTKITAESDYAQSQAPEPDLVSTMSN